MKEFLENKVIIAFVLSILVLSVTSGIQTKKFEAEKKVVRDTEMVLK